MGEVGEDEPYTKTWTWMTSFKKFVRMGGEQVSGGGNELGKGALEKLARTEMKRVQEAKKDKEQGLGRLLRVGREREQDRDWED